MTVMYEKGRDMDPIYKEHTDSKPGRVMFMMDNR
jgi:hypothetical protein